MITYNWEIVAKPTASTLNSYNNVILAVIWKLTGTDQNKKTAEVLGNTFFLPPSEEFIPYEDLTDEILISWIKAKEDYQSIVTEIESKINK
jgi:hypothetical protein